jgi:hypothetical protein
MFLSMALIGNTHRIIYEFQPVISNMLRSPSSDVQVLPCQLPPPLPNKKFRYFQSASGLLKFDRLFGLVARVPGYKSKGTGSIPGATKFSDK